MTTTMWTDGSDDYNDCDDDYDEDDFLRDDYYKVADDDVYNYEYYGVEDNSGE